MESGKESLTTGVKDDVLTKLVKVELRQQLMIPHQCTYCNEYVVYLMDTFIPLHLVPVQTSSRASCCSSLSVDRLKHCIKHLVPISVGCNMKEMQLRYKKTYSRISKIKSFSFNRAEDKDTITKWFRNVPFFSFLNRHWFLMASV